MTYPYYKKIGQTVYRIESESKAQSAYLWHDGSVMLITIYATPFIKNYVMEDSSEDEWQAHLRKCKTAADAFFNANIIPAKEEIEKL